MKVIRTDFKTAGIPLEDERGHRVDFHALRMTYITRLQRAAAPDALKVMCAKHVCEKLFNTGKIRHHARSF